MDEPPRIRTAKSRDFYLAYLNSPSWRATRARALQLAGYRCQRCGAKRDLQVHHKNYDRLGREWDVDLEVLCADCHEGEHVEQFEQSSGAIYLKLAREALRHDPTASLPNLAEELKVLCAKRKIPYNSRLLQRSLELVTGKAVTRRERPVHGEAPQPFSRQEAHELLRRLSAEVKSMK